MPSMRFALRAWTNCGTWPAASISSTIQVPVLDGLKRHRRAALAGGQELLQGTTGVGNPALVPACPVHGLHRHVRVALVGIEGDVLHGGAPPLCGDPTRIAPGSPAAYSA